jgi:hypothetical protein
LALIAIIIKRHLGNDYIVLDRAAKITFLTPGRGSERLSSPLKIMSLTHSKLRLPMAESILSS